MSDVSTDLVLMSLYELSEELFKHLYFLVTNQVNVGVCNKRNRRVSTCKT